jgi:hypothetical protein
LRVVRVDTVVCGGFRSIQNHTPAWSRTIPAISEYWTLRRIGGLEGSPGSIGKMLAIRTPLQEEGTRGLIEVA